MWYNRIMQKETLEMYETTPKLNAKRCRYIALAIEYGLKLSHILLALGIWYYFDYFFAIATLLIGYLVLGIVRSKLMHLSIPRAQQEFDYSDKEIAIWYVAKRLCYEDRLDKMDMI